MSNRQSRDDQVLGGELAVGQWWIHCDADPEFPSKVVSISDGVARLSRQRWGPMRGTTVAVNVLDLVCSGRRVEHAYSK